MSSTLTLDLGLNFDRVLPGEGSARACAPTPGATIGSGRQRRPTLDDLVAGVWEGLRTARPVACPICNGVMEPRYGSGPAPVGGRCASCRTTLG